MSEFNKSWQHYFLFERSVKRDNRYVRDKESEDFLKAVLDSAEKRVETIPEGTQYWRAQLGYAEFPLIENGVQTAAGCTPYSSERMKPLTDRAKGGRANPKGIPCLYVATKKSIAISEVRPWMDSYVTLALFKIIRTIRIVNCTLFHGGQIMYANPDSEEREGKVWMFIDLAFARPVNPTDYVEDYAPTQIIAEQFKVAGYDGIEYSSSFDGSGHNLALFNLGDAELINRKLCRIRNVNVEYEEYSEEY